MKNQYPFHQISANHFLKLRIEKRFNLDSGVIRKVRMGGRIYIVCTTIDQARTLENQLKKSKIEYLSSISKQVIVNNIEQLEKALSENKTSDVNPTNFQFS